MDVEMDKLLDPNVLIHTAAAYILHHHRLAPRALL